MVQEPQVTMNPTFKGQRQSLGLLHEGRRDVGGSILGTKRSPAPIRDALASDQFFSPPPNQETFFSSYSLSINVLHISFFNPRNNPTWALPAFCI